MKRREFIKKVGVGAAAVGAGAAVTAGLTGCAKQDDSAEVAKLKKEIADLKGKVVVLGLFHICEPCLIQSSNLQKVYEATRGQNVAVVGVNSSGDSQADVLEFLSTFPLTITYPYLTDPEKITDKLYGGGRFIPNVYIMDQQGVIRWQRVGNMNLADDMAILAQVNQLLKEPTGSRGSERL